MLNVPSLCVVVTSGQITYSQYWPVKTQFKKKMGTFLHFGVPISEIAKTYGLDQPTVDNGGISTGLSLCLN